jgi:phenylalanyl-tRNA synthetase beta chain
VPALLRLVIRGVRVGPSPEWLASRLRAIGLRPISNVVDATNYVLHELGQPLHAFDLDRLGGTVVVRTGAQRRADHHARRRGPCAGARACSSSPTPRPVAIAGVMGGADTEVQRRHARPAARVRAVRSASVRATRRAFGLSTDASYRFERGVDPDGMLSARCGARPS